MKCERCGKETLRLENCFMCNRWLCSHCFIGDVPYILPNDFCVECLEKWRKENQKKENE